MSDITKCTGLGCRKREQCYRYTALKNTPWQSWMNPPFGISSEGVFDCQSYWRVEEKPFGASISRSTRA